MKKGTAKPSEYAIVIFNQAPGSDADNAKIEDKIGPTQGDHPAAKPIPINIHYLIYNQFIKRKGVQVLLDMSVCL